MPLYFIGIVIPAEINNRVMEWKNYMLQHFRCKVALRSPAHITLIPPFNLEKADEALLSSDILEFSSGRQPFRVRIKNFSSFPPRVIFAGVESSTQLENMQKDFEAYLAGKNYPVKISTRPFHPHITIANRDLRKEDYHKAFSYFNSVSFTADFTATHIDLMISKPEGWVTASHIPMQTFDM
jgi:2'-5' RNA ligase